MEKQLLAIDIANNLARELTVVLDRSRKAYLEEYRRTLKRIYPWGWFSRAFRWLRKRFGRDYFSQLEVARIQEFLRCAAAFAKILDQRVLDQPAPTQETHA
jgi:hypothetical protein